MPAGELHCAGARAQAHTRRRSLRARLRSWGSYFCASVEGWGPRGVKGLSVPVGWQAGPTRLPMQVVDAAPLPRTTTTTTVQLHPSRWQEVDLVLSALGGRSRVLLRLNGWLHLSHHYARRLRDVDTMHASDPLALAFQRSGELAYAALPGRLAPLPAGKDAGGGAGERFRLHAVTHTRDKSRGEKIWRVAEKRGEDGWLAGCCEAAAAGHQRGSHQLALLHATGPPHIHAGASRARAAVAPSPVPTRRC